jgi:hypothetical protein
MIGKDRRETDFCLKAAICRQEEKENGFGWRDHGNMTSGAVRFFSKRISVAYDG